MFKKAFLHCIVSVFAVIIAINMMWLFPTKVWAAKEDEAVSTDDLYSQDNAPTVVIEGDNNTITIVSNSNNAFSEGDSISKISIGTLIEEFIRLCFKKISKKKKGSHNSSKHQKNPPSSKEEHKHKKTNKTKDVKKSNKNRRI